jgi:hypothetical protein
LTDEVDINEPKQIAVFQLLWSLSIAKTCLTLYSGEEAGRQNLPVQDARHKSAFHFAPRISDNREHHDQRYEA